MKDVLQSLGILFAISGSFALFFSEFGVTFWKSLIFVTAVQIVIWNVYQHYRQGKIISINQEIDKIAVENIAKQQVNLPCSSCGTESVIDIQLNTANTFLCPACDTKNAIYINIETAAMTIIPDTNKGVPVKN